jgi:hypothetical protein
VPPPSSGCEPRVRLDVKSKFGPVKTPQLTITGKVESNGNGHAKEEADNAFDDSIEF